MEGLEVKPNRLDPSVPIYIIYPNNDRWEFFEGLFDEFGHGFYSPQFDIIFLDSRVSEENWFTDDHLYVIESHELAHKIAGHTHGHDVESEMEADFIGHHILKSKGMETASELHKEEFQERYGLTIYDYHPTDSVTSIVDGLYQ